MIVNTDHDLLKICLANSHYNAEWAQAAGLLFIASALEDVAKALHSVRNGIDELGTAPLPITADALSAALEGIKDAIGGLDDTVRETG